MRAVRIIVLSVAWAALFVWWLDQTTWALTVVCLVAAPLVAFLSFSCWPMLVPVGVLAAVVGQAVIVPADGAECACEPSTGAALLVGGMGAVLVLGFAYVIGWLLRWGVSRHHRGKRQLQAL
jgi:hypothetical protein